MRHLLRLLLVLLCFGHLSFAASATVRAESSAQGEMLRMQLGAEELPSSFGGYAGISAARGDYLGPGFSLAAAVPFIGDFAAAGKAICSVTQVSRVSHSAAPVMSAARVERAVVANGGGRAGTEVVQRWMSQAELQATQTTGLLRGGRDGIHYVTDAANTAAQRARLRLALPQTPQVRATLEVPGGAFSAPSRAQPNFNMPGGGMERTTTGQIPVKILGVD